MTPLQMSCLRQDILCDLWLKFQTKRSDLRILEGDEMPKLRPYCFGRSCLSVEMLQWFVVLDFVLIFSLIQIF